MNRRDRVNRKLGQFETVNGTMYFTVRNIFELPNGDFSNYVYVSALYSPEMAFRFWYWKRTLLRENKPEPLVDAIIRYAMEIWEQSPDAEVRTCVRSAQSRFLGALL